jgi:8-oxo-dGTP diphosphatase
MTNSNDRRANEIKRGVVGVCFRNEQFLVIRRSQHVRSPGAYCFPGGTIEPGESEDVAVIRELLEELSLSIRPVRRLLTTETPWRVSLAWWLIDCEEFESMNPNPAEVEAVQWMSVAEMRALPNLLSSNHEFLSAWERGEFSLTRS